VACSTGLETSPKLYDAWQLKGDLLAQGDAAGAMAPIARPGNQARTISPAHSAVIRQLLAEGKLDEAANNSR
jgi:hypothetical protein